MGSLRAIGMLETAISPLGTVAVSWNVAFRPGSSQQGTKRRASEFSNWVNRARFAPPPVR